MIVLKPNWEDSIRAHHQGTPRTYYTNSDHNQSAFGTCKGYNEKPLTAVQQIKELTKLILNGQAKVE